MIRSLSALFALIAPAAAALQSPKVYLNHVVIVVDSATYAAIGADRFLRNELAGTQQLTTGGGGGATWTGTYVFGRNTYIEMFAPGGVAGAAGTGMISFGVETQGALWPLRARLTKALGGGGTDSLLRTRAKGKDEVPWFYAVSAPGVLSGSRFPTWVMEYYPDYQRLWDPSRPSDATNVRRATQTAGVYNPARLLEDIVAITVAVDPKDRDRLETEARAYGYRVVKAADRLVLDGPDLHLTVLPVGPDRRGVTELRLKLQRAPSVASEHRFGARSVLKVARDGTATWSF
ncbi:MAG: DUF5829 family protein [Gemmatimonadota bacterium]